MPPTNFYVDFYQNRPEQRLIEDLTIEAIKFYGHDVIYLPRQTIERDDIFGEDIRTLFKDNYMIEMYIESIDGFEGEGNILAKFGMQIKDTVTLVVSRKRFEEVVWEQARPLEGDLIYLPMSNGTFEVTFVEHENPFYELGKLHTYKLTCELFTYSHEEFDTGRPNINSIMDTYSNHNNLDVADNEQIEDEFEQIDADEENSGIKEPFTNENDDDPFGGL